MGAFADRVRKLFNPESAARIAFNRAHGLNDDAGLVKANDIKHRAYFIRIVGRPNLFLHWQGETRDQLEYVVKEGTIGACLWTLDAGKNFIKAGNQAEGLELIRVDQVINLEKK